MVADAIKQHISAWHLVAGVIMAILGIYMWLNPLVSMMALAIYLGVAFIVIGAGYLMFSFTFESGWYMLIGVLDLLVGVIFVTNLGVTTVSLPIIFALWCLAVGVIQIGAAFHKQKNQQPWSRSLGAGIFGVLFAFLILAYPSIGIFTITAFMGAYVLLYGILEIFEYIYARKILKMA